MGRPKKEINWEIVQRKIEAGCSAKEIYGGLVDENTFYERFKEHFGKAFADFSGELRSAGPGNIRFTQYMKALAGSAPMLQLCGREMCGQGKEPEKISPYEETMEIRHENMMLKAELARIKEIMNGDNKPQAE